MPTELANVNISQPALVCVFYVPACNYLARGVVCGDVCARCEVRKLRTSHYSNSTRGAEKVEDARIGVDRVGVARRESRRRRYMLRAPAS